MTKLIGLQGEKTLAEIGIARQIVSMGHQACAALELWNYPVWMRNLIPQNVDGTERPDHVDLPALESMINQSQTFILCCFFHHADVVN